MPTSRRVPLNVLERAVPFLIVVDRVGRVVHVGRLLKQVCPGLMVGESWSNHLSLVGADPSGGALLDVDDLVNRSLTLQLVGSTLRFRAEVLADGPTAVILANPLFTSQRQLQSMNLDLDDLPPSHPLGEYLALLNSLRGTLRETRDLSDRLAVQQRELVESQRVAERANAAKTRFLATTSHELRTPMHGVLGLLDATIAEQTISPEILSRLSLARTSAQGLLGLLDDLLDLAKIEAGELSLEAQSFDLVQLVHEVAGIVRPRAKVPVVVDLSADLPAQVLGDRQRIRQIMLNLAGNAVRFTQQGQVTLALAIEAETLSSASLRIEVRDTGPGINETAQHTIFDAFRQASVSTARTHGGTGLGLAIARDLVHAMGGRIDLQSEVGVGSTFSVSVTLELSDEPSVHPTEEAVSYALSGHVLVAEDNAVNQVVVRLVLDAMGVSSVIVDNGRAAVEAVARQAFDVVLMDVQMPELDGLEATRQIKERSPHLPVIGLTASTLSHELTACRNAGMDLVLPKPFTKEQVAGALSRWLARNAA